MANKYDLDTFEGRTGFDAMVEQYIGMDQDIADYDTETYAQEVWENLEFTNELNVHEVEGIDFVNDMTEAKARTFAVVEKVLKDAQEERAATDAENEADDREKYEKVTPIACDSCGYVAASREEFAEHNCIGREAAAAHDAARPEW